ncbi:MAG: hypothetical protein LUH10_16680 [Tannerellaceae bacterium]|nr:hypothetical protein [Tannerellaceae bacterium]
MEKKYKHAQPESEIGLSQSNKIEEPIFKYNKGMPCVFTDEEKIRQIKQSLQDAENGLGISHSEVISRYK